MMTIAYIIRQTTLLTCAAISISAIGSCGNRAGSTTQVHTKKAREHGHEKPGQTLELSQGQLDAVGIMIGNIEEKNLTDVVKASGQLDVPPQNSAQVNVLTGGIIRKINVMEGQQVNKGQVLVAIENQDLIKVQQDYLTAKGAFSFVELEFKRQQQLKAANAGTGRAQQLAEANYNVERARIKSLARQLQQYGIAVSKINSGNISSQMPLTAPIKGTVGKINAKTGSYAQPGISLMDIVDNAKIHADLIVFERDLPKIKVGQQVNFQLTNQKNEAIEGQIYGINKSFENDSKGVVVHAVIRKPGANLIPGMYVTGLIGVGTVKVSAVPVEAVIRSEDKAFIFVVDEDANANHKEHEDVQHGETEEKRETADGKSEKIVHFKKIEVITGVIELGYVQISPLEKLPAGIKVVIKGAVYLQSKASAPAEHSH